ncbi:hypothetical protein PENTCL1PPCAC_26339, partial [Pristionchus entomophagus]
QMDDWLISMSVPLGEKGETECDAGPFTLKVSWREEGMANVVEVNGELEHDLGESFRSIVDLRLSIGEKDEKWMVGNLWPSTDMSSVWRRKRRGKKNTQEKLMLKYRTNILSKTDLSEASRSRDFRVLCASKCWFVDVNRLVGHGGIFEEWKKKIDEDGIVQVRRDTYYFSSLCSKD